MAKAIFEIPLSFKLDAASKKFVDDLKQSTSKIGGAISGTAKKTGDGISGAVGGGVVGGLIGSGIGTLIAVASKILGSFKSLNAVVGNLLKVIGELLRPIADVIIVLLQPILQILKPIIKLVQQIMQPFRKLSLSLSRQAGEALREGDQAKATGLFALSITAALEGLTAVISFLFKSVLDQIVTLSGEMLKGLVIILGNLLNPILSVFGANTQEIVDSINAQIDNATKVTRDAMGFALASLFSAKALGIAKLADKLGADVSDEYKSINDMLSKVFVGSENSFKSTFDNFRIKMEDTLIPDMDSALTEMTTKFQDAADRINKISIQQRRTRDSQFGVLGRAFSAIFS